MIDNQRPIIANTIGQRVVPLNHAQRRRLLVRAISWISLSGIAICCCCTYGPLTIDWLIPASAGLPIAVVGGIVIASADITMVCVLFFGLALLQEAIVGTAIQATEIVHAPMRSMRAASPTVRGERVGALRVATPDVCTSVQSGEWHSITYSPRARILWNCQATKQAEHH